MRQLYVCVCVCRVSTMDMQFSTLHFWCANAVRELMKCKWDNAETTLPLCTLCHYASDAHELSLCDACDTPNFKSFGRHDPTNISLGLLLAVVCTIQLVGEHIYGIRHAYAIWQRVEHITFPNQPIKLVHYKIFNCFHRDAFVERAPFSICGLSTQYFIRAPWRMQCSVVECEITQIKWLTHKYANWMKNKRYWNIIYAVLSRLHSDSSLDLHFFFRTSEPHMLEFI